MSYFSFFYFYFTTNNFEFIDKQNTSSMFLCLCNYFANLSPKKLDIQLLADKKKINVTLADGPTTWLPT